MPHSGRLPSGFRRVGAIIAFALMLSACASVDSASNSGELPPPEISLVAATPTPSPTRTPLPTPTPTATATFTPTSTPQWVWNEPGRVTVPILLYHHISDEQPYSRYYVGTERFKDQMKALRDWGYTTISMSLLLKALLEGAELPPRPIVITFDDGHISVHENAFPIMQELGFIGVNFIVAERLKADDFMGTVELDELLSAGWEVGSHGMTHTDLTEIHSQAKLEILDSRLRLEEELDTSIDTFAYPFGSIDSFVANRVSDYGYKAGIGLGTTWEHTFNTLFYLSRIEIFAATDLTAFAEKLPWSGPLTASN